MKRLRAAIFIVSATLLSSCLRSNLSGWADNVGRLEPHPVRDKTGQIPTKDWRIYRLDGQYYLQADLKYEQKATRIFYADSIIDGPHGGILLHRNATAPARSYMIRLRPDKVTDALGQHIAAGMPGTPLVIPSEEFDFSRATPCPLKDAEPLRILLEYSSWYLPEQQTATHYAMQPVAALLWCVDIPLTIGYNIIWMPCGFIWYLCQDADKH